MATTSVFLHFVVWTQQTSMVIIAMLLEKDCVLTESASPKATSLHWSGDLLIYHQCKARLELNL